MSRCFGCFAEMPAEGGKCPHCGFALEYYEYKNYILRPGTELKDRYVIGKRLGEGGFGITYLAWDKEMQERVAIKEYYPGGVVSRDVTSVTGNSVQTAADKSKEDFDEGMKRYIREAAILAKFCKLPGIVTVKDFFYGNATAYIVMEYIDGISLKEYLKQKGGRISCDEAVALMKPVISSLATIHNNSLLHRDISPDNIMLSKNGEVKLIDFGAARMFGNDENRSMTIVLKHGYAPMEQYSRHGKQGAWTDVYAICAVIYKCITGNTPVEALDRINEDTNVALERYPNVSAKVGKAVDKGLSVMAENRHRDLGELYEALYGTGKGSALKRNSGIIKAVEAVLAVVVVLLLVAVCTVLIRNAITKKAASDGNDAKDEYEIVSVPEDAMKGGNGDKNSTPAIYPVWMNTDAVDQGILVVSEGILDGYSTDVTVNDMLEAYSDTKGEWKGYETDRMTVVYYSGNKNGETFDFIFEVNGDNTFRLSGANRGGMVVDSYSDMFKEVLREYGIQSNN